MTWVLERTVNLQRLLGRRAAGSPQPWTADLQQVCPHHKFCLLPCALGNPGFNLYKRLLKLKWTGALCTFVLCSGKNVLPGIKNRKREEEKENIKSLRKPQLQINKTAFEHQDGTSSMCYPLERRMRKQFLAWAKKVEVSERISDLSCLPSLLRGEKCHASFPADLHGLPKCSAWVQTLLNTPCAP